MPDVALVVDGKGVGAIGYRELNLQWVSSRFIEDGYLPSDAQVIDQTWQHPNKEDGGPDRRFSSNRRIPVCLYEDLLMTSASGLNELIEFSRTGVSEPFARALQRLARLGDQSHDQLELKIAT